MNRPRENSHHQQTAASDFGCPACGARNRASARFCRACGLSREELEQIEARHEDKLRCGGCSQAVRISDRFCCHCGTGQPFRILSHMKVCRQCNVQLPEAANYCPGCGNDVGLGSAHQIPVPVDIFEDEDPDSFPTFEC